MSSSEESRALASRIVAQSAVQFKVMEIIRDLTVHSPTPESGTNVQKKIDPATQHDRT